jgi:DNA processing protein
MTERYEARSGGERGSGERARSATRSSARPHQYVPPDHQESTGLYALNGAARSVPGSQAGRLQLPGFDGAASDGPLLYVAGDTSLVQRRCVSIVGSRKVTHEGARRARRLARLLAERGVVVVSGLAEGVDTAAHTAAIEAEGSTIAVIATPLDRCYPQENALLQERIHRDHLLVSPYGPGSNVYKSNFPHRNRIMAAISDATVIMEASDTSGSLHQAAECGPSRLDRWLFIAASIVEDPKVAWPRRFIEAGGKVRVLRDVSDIFDVLGD